LLGRHYPASSLVRASPSPHTAWPAPHGGPVDGHAPPPLGLPVLRRISCCPHAVVNTPAGPRAGVARHVAWWQPSPFSRRVGPCVACFEACSTFTARYGLLARGVAKRPFPPKASTASLPPRSLRLLPVRTVAWCSVLDSPASRKYGYYGKYGGGSRRQSATLSPPNPVTER
jgi:hypothetical protein